MISRLKFIGLALTAVFAFSAVAASAASAVEEHEFHSDSEVTHLTAAATGPQVFFATTGDAKRIQCEKVNVSGTITGTEVEPETYKADEVTVEPAYSECGIWEGPTKIIGLTITSTGCHYLFGSDTDANGDATVNILDTAGTPCANSPGGFTVSVLGQACLHIEPTTELEGGVHYNNVTTENGVKDIEVEATVSGIDSVTTNHPLVGCAAVEGETHTTGTYTGKIDLTGYRDAAHTEPANITLK